VFGAMGFTTDTPLADHYTVGRILRVADGPDEVHLQSIARMELRAGRNARGATAVYLDV